MTQEYIIKLILGIISSPILWILSSVIASNVIPKPFSHKLLYLSISGILLGYICLYVWKAKGEIFIAYQTFTLIFLSLIIMLFVGSLFYLIFNIFKSRS